MKNHEAQNFIKKHRKFLIVIHQKPDGDCIGSALAFKLILKELGKSGEVILLDELPQKYKFLPFAAEILEIEKIEKSFIKQFDSCVFIDCGSLEVSGIQRSELGNLPILNIDHHPTNDLYGDINLVEPEKAASAEILYDLFTYMDIKIKKDVATLLFCGIFTDTGGFQHSNTTLGVLDKAASLQKKGVNITKLSKNLFNTRSIASLKILGLALSRIRYNKKYKIVYSVITEKDKLKYGVSEEDLGGTVNMIAGVPFVQASLLLYEAKGKIKGSFRTERNKIDVAALAQVLGGGGHKKASGFRISGKLKKDRTWKIV